MESTVKSPARSTTSLFFIFPYTPFRDFGEDGTGELPRFLSEPPFP
jgi:hypothetical protein